MDHDALIVELQILEQMAPLDRLSLAKPRRELQIMKFQEFESRLPPILHRSRKPKLQIPLNFTFIAAVNSQDSQEVEQLLKDGADPNCTDDPGENFTPLHSCAMNGYVEVAKILIENGANIDAEDCDKCTPLHAVAMSGNRDMAKFLIKNGANLLAMDSLGKMPFEICEDEATLELIETEMALLEITVDLIQAKRDEPEQQMLKDMHELVQQGQNFNFQDENNGSTYLHIAAANGYQNVVEFLIKNGVSLEIKDFNGNTAADLAKAWGHENIVTFIQNCCLEHTVALFLQSLL